MYDLPELRPDHAALWTRLREALAADGIGGLPDKLHDGGDLYALWRDPALLFAQTCGYPFVSRLRGTVRLLATPCYDADGCDNARYRSWLITREREGGDTLADFQNRRLVINAWDSLSGCKVVEMMMPESFDLQTYFSAITVSGAHAGSIDAVARDEADIAAIDCVTWTLLARHRPAHLKGLRVVASGPRLPALPLITAQATGEDELRALRRAFDHVIDSPRFTKHRRRLALRGIAVLEASEYDEILERLTRT